jgi:hypothetical protein
LGYTFYVGFSPLSFILLHPRCPSFGHIFYHIILAWSFLSMFLVVIVFSPGFARGYARVFDLRRFGLHLTGIHTFFILDVYPLCMEISA